jgi:arylsulfatase A-like enzyme
MRGLNCAVAAAVARRSGWFIGVLLTLSGVTGPDAAGAESRPNFVVIVADDLRFDAAGASGNRFARTPALDSLAARSVRFTNGFVTLAHCTASRAAFLTGRYGSATGVLAAREGLLPTERTVAHLLRDAGYRTGLVGKWDLNNRPDELGFEESTVFHRNGTYYGRAVNERGRTRRVPGHIEEYCAGQSIAFIKRAQAERKPFLLFHCPQLPHMNDRSKWDATPRARARFSPGTFPLPDSWMDDGLGKPPYLQAARSRVVARDEYSYDEPEAVRRHLRDYHAVVSDLDTALSRLLAALDDLELRRNTFVILSSDGGFFIGEHRLTSKILAYEESMRVPFWVSGPGLGAADDDRLVLNIDVAPTLLELAGLTPPRAMHGASLVPLLRRQQAASWRSSFHYESDETLLGVWPLRAVRTDRWKYIQTFEPGRGTERPVFEELYDLRNDPGERRNRALEGGFRPKLEELEKELAALRGRCAN